MDLETPMKLHTHFKGGIFKSLLKWQQIRRPHSILAEIRRKAAALSALIGLEPSLRVP